LLELISKIYSCRKKNKCLNNRVDCFYPEAFLGNLNAKFAIVGINPSGRGDLSFSSFDDYVDFCKEALDEEELRDHIWPRGFLAAYRMLVDAEATVDDFNENVVILNVVKCSTTPSWGDLPFSAKWAKEEAKNKCKVYLIQQLTEIQPQVILTHGRPACDFMIDLIRKGTNYDVDSSSCDLSTLAELNLQNVPDQNRLSNHWVSGTSKEGQKTLFLFNTQLSLNQVAMHNLNLNLKEKQSLVKRFLQL